MKTGGNYALIICGVAAVFAQMAAAFSKGHLSHFGRRIEREKEPAAFLRAIAVQFSAEIIAILLTAYLLFSHWR